MPSSPRKKPKATAKSSKSKTKAQEASTPTKSLLEAPNTMPPPTTPRLIDFNLDEASDHADDNDGWASSDDSFEEKITWSRHRMRVIPGGCTPRNIQEVRRRLNLEALPEDQSPSTTLKVLPVRAKPVRPSTPVKQFKAKDPSVLPPTPSPKKEVPTARPSVVKTPGKPASSPPRPKAVGTGITSPRRITQCKEFTFATEARSRRSSPLKPRDSNVVDQVKMDGNGDGEGMRSKLREMGKASILAWGETRGRYLDD